MLRLSIMFGTPQMKQHITILDHVQLQIARRSSSVCRTCDRPIWAPAAPGPVLYSTSNSSMPQARNNRPRKSQPAAAETPSALLQFLEKLDDDIFCQTLLPMLIGDDSAADLAATCSQLRKLCHSSIKQLDLRPSSDDDMQPNDAEQWTQNLHEHFPQCSSLLLQVQESESYQAVNYMLPALARLPDLSTLSVDVNGPPLAEMLPMAMLLRSLRTHLTSLKSLFLVLSQSWTGAGLAWAELAAMTQLTGLCIEYTCKDGYLCNKADLLQLSVLCGLENMSVTCEDIDDQAQHPISLQLVSQMNALTALKLSVCSADGLESLHNSVGLQHLNLYHHTGVCFELSAAHWGVIGQLTQLTELTLWPVTQRTNFDAFRSALQQLTGLHRLNVLQWAPEVVGGLQGLSQLTSVGGGWSAGDGYTPSFTLPQVQTLWTTQDHIPCTVFPSLLYITLFDSIPSAVLSALSRQCTLLQSLRLTCLPEQLKGTSCTLRAAEPVTDRVAAVMSLSNLHHLTALDFAVKYDAELLALTHSTAALASHELAELRLLVPEDSDVTSSGMFALGRLSDLDALDLWLLKPTLMRSQQMAQVFVPMLVGVERLRLFVEMEEQHTSLSNAFEHAESCGLPLAPEHSITILD